MNEKTTMAQQLSQVLAQLQLEQHDYTAIEKWQPKLCGEMDLVIRDNGDWEYQGSKITRQAMINLFAKVLWREDEQYFLKTPVEKLKIQVQDVPLFIYNIEQVQIDGISYLQCHSTTGDVVTISEQHPIFMQKYQGQWRPYVHIRLGLNALILRSAFFQLIDYGELQEDSQDNTILYLQSGDLMLKLMTPN